MTVPAFLDSPAGPSREVLRNGACQLTRPPNRFRNVVIRALGEAAERQLF